MGRRVSEQSPLSRGQERFVPCSLSARCPSTTSLRVAPRQSASTERGRRSPATGQTLCSGGRFQRVDGTSPCPKPHPSVLERFQRVDGLSPWPKPRRSVLDLAGQLQRVDGTSPWPKPLKPVLDLAGEKGALLPALSRAVPSLQCGVAERQNMRSYMEDKHVILVAGMSREQPGLAGWSLFAIFDGHGGEEAAVFLSSHLPKLLAQRRHLLQLPDPGPAQALRGSLHAAEEAWLKLALQDEKFDGSAVVVALIDEESRRCLVANIGDCQAVVGVLRPGADEPSVEVLTELHDAQHNADEAKRVLEAGGGLWRGRLMHPQFNPDVMSVGLTRAIGDLAYKHPRFTNGMATGLSAQPAMSCTRLQPAAAGNHQVLILASDGFWNYVSHEQAVLTVTQMRHEPASFVSESLCELAQSAGSKDNITVMLVIIP